MSQFGHQNIKEPLSPTTFLSIYYSQLIWLFQLFFLFLDRPGLTVTFFLLFWNALASQKFISTQRPDASSNNNYVAQSNKPIVQPSKSGCLIKEGRLLFLHCTFVMLCLTSYMLGHIYIRRQIYMFLCFGHRNLQHEKSRAPTLVRGC